MYARPDAPSGEPARFGVSGRLWRDSLIMFDRETESLWSQVLGRSVQGELEGTELRKVPSFRGTWSEWKALHPHTLALAKPEGIDESPYARYFSNPATLGVHGRELQDRRLPGKSVVLGLELEGRTVAVPLEEERSDLVKVRVGSRKLVVLREGLTAVAFDAGASKLRWSVKKGLRDRATGAAYDPRTGARLGGGEGLEPVAGVVAYWFAWSSFHPDTKLKGLLAPATGPGQSWGAQSQPRY